LSWLLAPILLITIPAGVFAGGGRGAWVAMALVARALSAATAALATVTYLGPSGTVAGLRALRVPKHLVEVVHAMLVSLGAIARQVAGMQRARSARRARATPWASLASAPFETLRAFGGLAGALLLRVMERAESLERARRARGGADG
jgi:energy-coupling factor transporter transmembrane protein EcfT